MAPSPTLSEFLLSLPSVGDLSPRSQILLVGYNLLRNGQTRFSAAELSKAFVAGGLPRPRRLGQRLAQLSVRKGAPLLRVAAGKFALSIFGQKEIQDYLGNKSDQPVEQTALAKLVGKLTGDAEQQFLAEAVACVQVKARRAVVVMVWLLTVDHLQRFVIAKHLADFNIAWSKRVDCKGRTITIQDDFLEIRDESAFIEILRAAGIITNDVRKILDEKLGFRNTCAHPNDIVIPESKVYAAIEDLVNNVLLKYPL